jgi:membrane protein
MKKELKNLAGNYGLLITRTLAAWFGDNGLRMGAALAYYALFSLAPLLIIALAIAGSFFGDAAAQDEVFRQVRSYVGAQGARAVRDLMGSAASFKSGFWGAGVSAGVLFFTASGMVSELQGALNDIWRVAPAPRPWLALLRRRALTLAFVVGSGFLLLLALLLSALASALGSYVGARLPVPEGVLHAVNFVLVFGLTTLVFALVYKYLPDARIAWRDVWTGAGVTAGLLTLGNLVIGFYLAKSGITTAFGAAGSLILVLVWIFYCSQLLYLGAEFTRIHAQARGLAVGQRAGS